MYPEILTLDLPALGRVTITSFGVLMVLAFLAGYLTIRIRLRELGRPEEIADEILLGALVGGILGAKLYYMLLHWDQTAADPAGMILARGGLVWYGGLIGGAAGVAWVTRRRGVSLPVTADLVAPALALSYGIGRIGCFLVGDDYGRPTDSWVGMAFPEGYPPTTAGQIRRHFGVEIPEGVPDGAVLAVFPTQLFEAAAGLLIFVLLWRGRDHARRAGWLFAAWMVAAGLERLFIEVFRAKDDRFFGPLTLAQAISVALVLGGAYLWMRLTPETGALREDSLGRADA